MFKYCLEFKNMVEKQTGHKIKRLVNDNGGEYLEESFQLFLRNEGIIMDKTAAYTPQQNPVLERGNRTTTERARCMLMDANFPKQLWSEAVSTAVYIENRSPEASIEFKTPHKLWYNSKPDLSHIRMFGCTAYKLIPKQFRGLKFASTSTKQILLGYQDRLHNYRLLNPANGQISYSHDVVFDKNNFSRQTPQVLGSLSSPDLLSEDFDLPAPPEPSSIGIDLSLETPEVTDEPSPTSPSPETPPENPSCGTSASFGLTLRRLSYPPPPKKKHFFIHRSATHHRGMPQTKSQRFHSARTRPANLQTSYVGAQSTQLGKGYTS